MMTTMALIGVAFAPITLTPVSAHASTTALIMGGSGLGDPTELPNYIPNVENYYIAPNSTCQPATCELVSVVYPGG
jgi:DNA transposition AAA+ family ATPase